MAKKNQELETMPETFKTTYPSTRCILDLPKYFVKHPRHCPPKTVPAQVISTISNTKVCLE